MENNKQILLHACCGICAGYPIEFLKNEGYEVVVYFYNPNLDTLSEYNKRLDALKILCDSKNCKLIAEPYDNNEFLVAIKGLENEPEGGARCPKCFEIRLKKTFEKSQELKINEFSTTLTVSPHKNFELISQIGKKISDKFLAIKCKKNDGFLKTNKISKELELYRQNYCGCNLGKKKGE